MTNVGRWIRYQVELFFLALSFFSRLPIPSSTPYSTERMNRAGRYFALVGTMLGLLCGCAYTLMQLLLPTSIAILLTIVFSLLLTGAFHEDGLADMADGIGGGMTVERRLAIMKDSRLGTYGTVTIVLALLLKFQLLTEVASNTDLLTVFVLSYTYSRALAASLISALPYVSDPDTSKSKPLASTQTQSEFLFLILCAVCSSLLFGMTLAIILAAVAVLFRWLFIRWLIARLGGFTGDCLGAAQQIMELLIYVVLLIWLPLMG